MERWRVRKKIIVVVSSVANRRVVRVAGVWLLIQRRGVVGVLVVGGTLVILWEGFFDLPVVLLDADGELEIFSGDGVPVLDSC